MIQKIQAYKSSDGTAHSTLEEAQLYELRALVKKESVVEIPEIPDIVGLIFQNADKVVDILTMKPNSLPKARKINGGTKKRQPKHIAEQFSMPLGESAAK